jgi:hypothetical protein
MALSRLFPTPGRGSCSRGRRLVRWKLGHVATDLNIKLKFIQRFYTAKVEPIRDNPIWYRRSHRKVRLGLKLRSITSKALTNLTPGFAHRCRDQGSHSPPPKPGQLAASHHVAQRWTVRVRPRTEMPGSQIQKSAKAHSRSLHSESTFSGCRQGSKGFSQ